MPLFQSKWWTPRKPRGAMASPSISPSLPRTRETPQVTPAQPNFTQPVNHKMISLCVEVTLRAQSPMSFMWSVRSYSLHHLGEWSLVESGFHSDCWGDKISFTGACHTRGLPDGNTDGDCCPFPVPGSMLPE